jgi:FHS family L-fucose permease-like MFS transporter
MPSISVTATQAPSTGKKVGFREMFVTADGRNHLLTFILVSTLFALWGFCNGQLDTLNKHFQNSLGVTLAESTFVQFVTFIGYAIMAFPAGMFAHRFGYKGGILLGLGLVAAGSFWFIPATRIGTYPAFLTGLFIIAFGLACLETVANPYTTVLGPPEASAARINLAQSTNGLGVLLGPIIGGAFYLSDTGQVNISNDKLYLPYLGIGIVVTLLAIAFALSKVPEVREATTASSSSSSSGTGRLWNRPHFAFAVFAQFCYVGAQIALWGLFINYLTSKDTMPPLSGGLAHALPASWTFADGDIFRVTDRGGSWMLSLGGFGLFLVGRLSGSWAMRMFKPQKTLALYGAINVAMMLLVFLRLGWLSVFGLFASNFFMSIMFPTIFSLGLVGLGDKTKKASSFIVMSIGGGAVFPLLNGWIAGHFSLSTGAIVPLLCFAAVMAYALSWEKLELKGRTAA